MAEAKKLEDWINCFEYKYMIKKFILLFIISASVQNIILSFWCLEKICLILFSFSFKEIKWKICLKAKCIPKSMQLVIKKR